MHNARTLLFRSLALGGVGGVGVVLGVRALSFVRLPSILLWYVVYAYMSVYVYVFICKCLYIRGLDFAFKEIKLNISYTV